MSNHAEDTLLSLLDDVDAVEYLAKTSMSSEVIPTEGIRPVVEWCVQYYFDSGRLQAPSKEAIRATWGQRLDDLEVTLGDGTEGDTIEWAVDELTSQHAQTVSGEFAKTLAQEVFEADGPDKVRVLTEAAHRLTQTVLGLQSRVDQAEAKMGLLDSITQYEARVAAGNAIYGACTGWDVIDHFIGGVHDGELFVLAAGPKTGKSFALAKIAWSEFLRGKTVVLFTLENSKDMTYDRMLCGHLGIDPDRYRRGECNEAEVFRINTLRSQVDDLPGTLHVIKPGEGDSTVEFMVRTAEMYEADVLLIDQLTFVDNPGGHRKARHENVREIMHDLKRAISTGRYKVPCFLAHQINREGIKQAKKEDFLSMEMLAEGSEVERTADFVFGLYQSAERRANFLAMLQMLATRRTGYKAWEMVWNINEGTVRVNTEIEVPS